MKRMTVECACERGGDCSRTTMCALDNALQDQADMYEAKLDAFSQLADEMQDSECGPFPDKVRNEGWCNARSFYANEIRAIGERE
jgi:hypothetical protein